MATHRHTTESACNGYWLATVNLSVKKLATAVYTSNTIRILSHLPNRKLTYSTSVGTQTTVSVMAVISVQQLFEMEYFLKSTA